MERKRGEFIPVGDPTLPASLRDNLNHPRAGHVPEGGRHPHMANR